MAKTEIRINVSWLLYENESAVLQKIYGKKGTSILPPARLAETVEEYRYAWSQYEDRLLPAMQAIFKLRFYKPVIDVSIAPWFRPQSDPLIINPRYDADEFVDILAHELLHVLLTDNNIVRLRDGEENDLLLKKWQLIFGQEHNYDVLAHIPVHAGLKYLYLDVLKNELRYERDKQSAETISPDYKAAWDYVEANDYKRIIRDTAKIYR